MRAAQLVLRQTNWDKNLNFIGSVQVLYIHRVGFFNKSAGVMGVCIRRQASQSGKPLKIRGFGTEFAININALLFLSGLWSIDG